MKTLLFKLFLQNWPRKLISLILAIIVWFVVSQSMASTKTIGSIPVRIINIPEGKTVEGLQSNGILQKRLTLTISGNKNLLDELSSNDLEVIIDAANKQDEWIATITKKNLVSLSPDLNIYQGISKVSHKNFILKMTNLMTERIPLVITQPIGQSPKGYQFLDIWPYHLYLTISGPENMVKDIKNRGIKLTFNLNDISEAQLDDLQANSSTHSDVVSFYVPNYWKQISLPMVSSNPIPIDDPDANFLRIDFVRSELLPINHPLPVNLFFPAVLNPQINPQKISISQNDLIDIKNGQRFINQKLYARGVSELFLDVVSDMIEVVVIASQKTESNQFDWSLQFINPRILEDRYVSILLSDVSDKMISDLQPKLREEYLRNRFRSYMNRMSLYSYDFEKLNLSVELLGNKIIMSEKTNHHDSE